MVDEYNRPLYGDPFGVLGDQDGQVGRLFLVGSSSDHELIASLDSRAMILRRNCGDSSNQKLKVRS